MELHEVPQTSSPQLDQSISLTATTVNPEKLKRQLQLEEESVEMGVGLYRSRITKAEQKGTLSELPPGLRLLHLSLGPMTKAVDEFMVPKRGGGHLGHVRGLLKDVPTLELAFITVKTVVDAITTEQPMGEVAVIVGQNVLTHIEYRKFKQQNPGYVHAIEKSFQTRHPGHRRTVLMLKKRQSGIPDEPWSKETKLHVGWKLLNLLIESTGIVEWTLGGAHRYRMLIPSEAVMSYFENANARCEVLHPLYLPMVIPPVRWTGLYGGGFLSSHRTNRHPLIKTTNQEALKSQGEMPLVYRAVNALQETPWRINRRIFEVVSEMWETSTGMGVLPNPDREELPPTPWESDEEYKLMNTTSPEEVKQWKMKAAEIHGKNAAAASKRFALKFKLCLSEKFLDEPEIYFCWNTDWRGRMYPLQPHLNPQSDDVGRALLQFADGKPIGTRGRYWLAVHGANLFGYDKVAFDTRVSWIDENVEHILDSARNPLDGGRFWTRADDPLQFLAFCFEWEGVTRDGADFVSHIPVQMDGTCNGLQHFSALLRDPVGAKATSLAPSDEPSDIYREVADAVSCLINQDLGNHSLFKTARRGTTGSTPLLHSDMARFWSGKVDRKLCKQSVMTTPYGVSRQGMEQQLRRGLAEQDGYEKNGGEWDASIYLAEKVDEAIASVVVAAPEAKLWLQEVTSISNGVDLPICWTTPSGFRVRQEVFTQKIRPIETSLGRQKVKVSIYEDTKKLNKQKHKNSISPNLIHSLDASHLVLTVNKCLDADICDFAMIHDSYGTHAANVDSTAALIRQAFVEMYQEPVLERFRKEVMSHLPARSAAEVPPVPPMGEFDIRMVTRSRYFFS